MPKDPTRQMLNECCDALELPYETVNGCAVVELEDLAMLLAVRDKVNAFLASAQPRSMQTAH